MNHHTTTILLAVATALALTPVAAAQDSTLERPETVTVGDIADLVDQIADKIDQIHTQVMDINDRLGENASTGAA